ncbi:hypothetical protein EJ069_10320 [Mesorhizobium sp. M2A.F.Ca.ET.043.05.1.1]|uniref:hypothetical protein n=1 Tax=Mesorhizobium sp. M2A.F.Ca.ET.043.05.1.1 TaxID=2493671 RepID=UPI000F75B4B7|nr:hypothetical protein [Mesorhizobium sp. M2A.F.Ca.ET.043.05.1.1]AZO15089.1 hypothetical protein EJ069_10320 [Mesorhizobium sp. M2A.F.Ca.ET.043.05.1.1]
MKLHTTSTPAERYHPADEQVVVPGGDSAFASIRIFDDGKGNPVSLNVETAQQLGLKPWQGATL